MSADISKERQDAVAAWLGKVLGGSRLPAFELTEVTVDALFALAAAADRREAECALLTAQFRESARQWKEKSDSLGRILSRVSCGPESLEPADARVVQDFSRMVSAVGISTTETDVLALVVTELLERQSLVELDRARGRTEEALLSDLAAEAQLLRGQLRRIESELQASQTARLADAENDRQKAAYMTLKVGEYQQYVNRAKELLNRGGLSADVLFGSLSRLAEDVARQQQALEPRLLQLRSYENLPPDMILAKIHVEEARRKLATLEDQLSEVLLSGGADGEPSLLSSPPPVRPLD